MLVNTHNGVDAGHGVSDHLHLKVLHDEVVSSVLQQLLFEMLRRVEVLARRITPLALALSTTHKHNVIVIPYPAVLLR